MKFEIPLQPITKKNSQRIVLVYGRPIIMPSKQFKDYEKACGKYITPPSKPIDYPVQVKCIYYMKTKRKVDLTNLLEATDDILVNYKVVEDDNRQIIASHDGSRVYYNKNEPRVEITISKLEEDYPIWTK